MAQQTPQQGSGFGTAGGAQQLGQQGQRVEPQAGQQLGLTLEDALSGEMRLTLHDFVQTANVCEWCADQCIDEGAQMADCIRLCRDVADLATQNVRFLTRDSVFGTDLAEIFAYAAEECARECSQHSHEHCQECASVLRRAVNSTREMLDSLGHRPQGRGQGQSQMEQTQRY